MTNAVALVAMLALWSSSPTPEGGGMRTYALPWGGSLEVPVPRDWKETTTTPTGVRALSFTLTPPQGKDSGMVIVTVLRGPTGDVALRALVEKRGRELLPTAVEKSLRLEELSGAQARGYYYSLTDRAPKPGEHTYLTQGAAAVGDLSLSFTILTASAQTPARQAGLDLVRGTRPGPSAR